MSAVSTRYVPHIFVLVVVAAIPTLLHSLGRFDVSDCAAPERLLGAPEPSVTAVDRRRFDAAWGAGNWSAGEVPGEAGAGPLHYVIARSFDPKTVYHWPEARVVWDARPEHHGVEEVEVDGMRIPVHRPLYEPESGGPREWPLVEYVLVYHARPVENPYLAQVLSGPRQVVAGRRPMWLFLVYGRFDAAARSAAEERGREWLASAWERHRAACGG